MKTPAIETKQTNLVPNKKSLEFQKVLMGMRLDESMTSTLKYVNFLSRILKFREISFLHVSPFFNPGINPYLGNPITGYPLGEIYSEDLWKRDEKELDHLEKALQATVKNVWEPFGDTEIDYVLKEGAPLDELVNQTNETAADLVVVGKSMDTNRHQIKVKNIIRQTDANVLLVPENSEPVLERILVPFDFSKNAIRALNFAVAIKECMPTPVIVQVLNVYQEPNLPPYKIGRTSGKFKEIEASTHREAFDNFLAEQLPEIRNKIHPITLLKGDKSIAYYLLNKAETYKSDLIIMGAKGHSKLELLLMGSTTERLVNRNNKIPMLIVK